MKMSGKCYLKNQDDNFKYKVEFLDLTSEQVTRLKKIGRENKPVKINIEIEEPILDAVERRYLKRVIRPYKKRQILINKHNSRLSNYEQITIDIRFDNFGQLINLPPFQKNTMYKGMELNRIYTLKELEL